MLANIRLYFLTLVLIFLYPIVNSGIVVSLSKQSDICQEMDRQNICYQNFGRYEQEVNFVCLDTTNTNSIKTFCGNDTEPKILPEYISEICPKIAKSKISYNQCYNSFGLRQENA